jgi:hypothetical protein
MLVLISLTGRYVLNRIFFFTTIYFISLPIHIIHSNWTCCYCPVCNMYQFVKTTFSPVELVLTYFNIYIHLVTSAFNNALAFANNVSVCKKLTVCVPHTYVHTYTHSLNQLVSLSTPHAFIERTVPYQPLYSCSLIGIFILSHFRVRRTRKTRFSRNLIS